MFNFYKKMKGDTKLIFWIALVVLILYVSDALLLGKFWHIPSPTEVNYSTGVVHVIKAPSKRNTTVDHIQLKTDDGQLLHLSCSYTAYYYPRRSGCSSGDRKEFSAKIYGKQAKVGWYIQKPLLGINNPYPQLIDLNVNGEQIISYQKKIENMRNDWKPTMIYILIQITGIVLASLYLYKIFNPKIKE